MYAPDPIAAALTCYYVKTIFLSLNLKNQRNEAQMRVKNTETAVSIPQVVSKQLSAHFLLAFVLRYVDFSDLDSPAQRINLAFYNTRVSPCILRLHMF